VVAFAPAKPGSGASTAATQCAFALKRATGGRVLLVDLDTQAGSIAFHLKLQPTYSVLDAVERSSRLDPGAWSALVTSAGGVDVLAAPEAPAGGEIDSNGLHEVLEYSRMLYDWVVVDLPSVFHRLTLFVLSEADAACLVATPDLASLHMARRAVVLLGQLGFTRERFQMVVNRMERRAGLSAADMEKIFGCPVFATLPEDPHSVHRMVTRVEPPARDSELGRALEQLAGKVRSLAAAGARAGRAGAEGRLAVAESGKAG
jgi:pilus assembly protein CpaE